MSHETIYRSLFIQARGVLKKELLGHLRSKRRIRRSQHSRIFKDSRGQIVDAISIQTRGSKIAPSPAIGKAISLVVQKTATLRRWWNDIRVLLPWSRCEAKTQLRSSLR